MREEEIQQVERSKQEASLVIHGGTQCSTHTHIHTHTHKHTHNTMIPILIWAH